MSTLQPTQLAIHWEEQVRLEFTFTVPAARGNGELEQWAWEAAERMFLLWGSLTALEQWSRGPFSATFVAQEGEVDRYRVTLVYHSAEDNGVASVQFIQSGQ